MGQPGLYLHLFFYWEEEVRVLMDDKFPKQVRLVGVGEVMENTQMVLGIGKVMLGFV